MARKFKQVHRKEIDFSLEDWAKVERRAAACGMKNRHISKVYRSDGQRQDI